MHKNVLVCVTQQKTCEKLIRQGAELSKEQSGNLYVLHVVNENDKFLENFSDGDALEYLFRITKDVGAELTVKRSKDVLKTIVEFADEMMITHIVCGNSRSKDNTSSFVTKLQKKLPDSEFNLI
ncbi:MAG: universal stress protein [Sedimentibacter sp.]